MPGGTRLRPSGAAPGVAGARRRALLAAALPLAAAGCGFRLRGLTELPFETFYSSLPLNSQFGGDLRRAVRSNGATVVDRREDAQVRFELLLEAPEREITALSTSGRPRELQLRLRLRWRVRGPKDEDLIAPTETLLRRNYTVLDTLGVASADEEALLYRDMRIDAVQQIVRRLSVVKVPR
ncbi:MAG TPA: LPS assembly lipoprotein LptE [Burkholderiaceae bacterium]|nr:LPS assembly lipoprotein LptE [Burkholderiaceae bacterium]